MPEHFYTERLVLAKCFGGVRRTPVPQSEADNSAGQRRHKGVKRIYPQGKA